MVRAGRTVPKLSRNDREDDHGEEAEEVEDEGEEVETGRTGSQEEESSEEERGQKTGREEGEEESQEAVSAQEAEGSGTCACSGTRTGADARIGGAVLWLRQRRRLSPRLRVTTTNRLPRSRRAVFFM